MEFGNILLIVTLSLTSVSLGAWYGESCVRGEAIHHSSAYYDSNHLFHWIHKYRSEQ